MVPIRKLRMRNYWFPDRKGGIFRPGKEIKGLYPQGINSATPHKESRRLTPPGRKRTLSGRELNGKSPQDLSHKNVEVHDEEVEQQNTGKA